MACITRPAISIEKSEDTAQTISPAQNNVRELQYNRLLGTLVIREGLRGITIAVTSA